MINLVSTLIHHALIYSPCELDEELPNIYNIFRDNGKPGE